MATKLGTLTLDLVARIGSFTQGMNQASSTAEREMRRVENSIVTVDDLIKKLAVTAGAAFSVSQISNYADSYTGIVNKLKLATNSQIELKTAMDDTHKIAQDTASDWSSVVDVYTKFQKISDKLGISQAEVARITETVTKAVGMSGASSDESQRSLVQFSQALSLGVLRGQDLNSVMQQTPGLTDAIAKGMGVTSDKLKQLGTDNLLTTQSVVDALQNVASATDAEYAKTATMVSASFNLIKNETIKMIGEFDAATSSSKTFVEGMVSLSNNMETVATTMGIGAAFLAGTYLPAMYSAVTAGYAKTKQMVEQTVIQYALVNAEKSAAATSLAQAQAQLVNTQSTLAALAAEKALELQRMQAQINSIGRMASATRMAQLRQIEVQVTAELTAAETALAAARTRSNAAAAAGMGVGRAALGILSGPVGMGVALATVAAGFLLMRDSSSETQSALEEQGLTVDQLKKKYSEMSAEAVKLRALDAASVIKKQNIQIRSSFAALQQVIDGLVDTSNISSANALTQYLSDLEEGGEKAAKAFTVLEAQNVLSDSQLRMVANFGQQVDESRLAVEKQNAILDIAKNKHNDLANAGSNAATGISNVAKEAVTSSEKVKNLDEEIQKFITNSFNTSKTNYEKYQLMMQGMNSATADMVLKAKEAEGISGTNKPLSILSTAAILTEIYSQKQLNDLIEKRNESEKARTEEIKNQQKVLKASAQVQANAAKYNFSGLESKYKLPSGMLTSIHAIETGNSGRTNQVNKDSGATGGFQFLKATGDQYGVKDRTNMSQSAEGAAKYMAYLLKLFKGDLEKAVRAYHAGEGNVQRGTGMGEFNNDYWKKFTGYTAGVNGYSEGSISSKDYEQVIAERIKLMEEQAAKQKEITLNIASEEVQIQTKLADDIEGIKKAGFSPEKTTEIIAEYQKRADIDIQIAKSSHEEKLSAYSDYIKTEEQLTEQSFARRQRDLKLDLTLTVDEYKKASILLEGERDKEMQKARWRALETRQAMVEQIKALSGNADNIFAKATMSPETYATWSLENERSNAQVALKDQRVGTEQDIMTSNSFESEDDRYQALLDAHKEYRDGMAALDVEYNENLKDIQNQTQAASIAGYGAMFGMMGSMLDAYGSKESTAYKIAFSLQKAFVLSSALLNAKGAVMAAWNDSSNTTIWSKMAAAAATVVQTNELMSAIQGVALSGMAHDGIDNIPKEGTWLLDKGERVVDSRTNSDLKNYLANGGGSGGGDVKISQSITFADGAAKVDTQGQKEIAQSLNNMMDAWARRESRQGRVLYNLVRNIG